LNNPQVWLANISLFGALAHAYLELTPKQLVLSPGVIPMNSIWKDLLSLHGHLVRKEDLDWRADTRTEAERNKDVAKKKANAMAVKCCAAVVWPRLAGPR
jgi:hypothetical protein